MGTDAGAPRVPPEALAECVRAILVAAGASGANARIVADSLVDADSAGRASHGTRQVETYVEKMREGVVSGTAEPEIVVDAGALVRIGGQRAFGQVVGEFAARTGIARAGRHGVCLVAIENATHLGRNARWAEIAAESGVASIHFGHGFGAGPVVVPHGGVEPKLRTSPVALGAPAADGRHVVFDFSVAEISFNTVKVLAERGEKLPPNAAVRADGTPSDDPREVLEGFSALLPFGGFKGYGLAVLAEIFGGIIAGGTETGAGVNAMLSIYIDVARATGEAGYHARLSDFLSALRAAKPLPDGPPVAVPGDRGREARRTHSERGLPVSAALRQSLFRAADRAGVPASERAAWHGAFAG